MIFTLLILVFLSDPNITLDLQTRVGDISSWSQKLEHQCAQYNSKNSNQTYNLKQGQWAVTAKAFVYFV